jgi:hypothetical protein
VSGKRAEDAERVRQLSTLLGSEPDAMKNRQTAGAAGQTFLLAYAPSDLDTERL